MKKILVLPLVCAGLSMSSVTWADNHIFPAAGVDETQSLGQFGIRLTKGMGKKLLKKTFCPGDPDNPAHDACLVWSPVLYDPKTTIGRSGPHTDGDRTDEVIGADVCFAGTKDTCFPHLVPNSVKDSDFTKVPNTDLFSEGPVKTREIHTQILSFNMTDHGQKCGGVISKNAVRAGSAAPDQARSLGEVESLNTSSTSDFPAESFFDIFVEVDVDWPPFGNIDMTLYNKSPLVIQSNELKDLPPTVVYIHGGNKGAPAVYDKKTGRKIGWIVIAGHGVGYDCTNADDFVSFISGLDEKRPLSVTLDSFTAKSKSSSVKLKWKTGTEKDNAGFVVWRGEPVNGQCSNDPKNYTNVQAISPLVVSQGTEVSGATYQMADNHVVSGNTYCYVLEDVEYDGDSTFHMNDIVSATPR